MVLVYPGYLTSKEHNDRVSSDLLIASNTPPTFLVMSQDDLVRVENVLGYAAALQQAVDAQEFAHLECVQLAVPRVFRRALKPQPPVR
jgi:acetyl esterase/lipase